ncbi:MAG: polysaccharide deacetylase family protein [Thermaerobacter sp.]|nr:polysaccharide deacetylase family protein [Thermaerobacter sp.]
MRALLLIVFAVLFAPGAAAACAAPQRALVLVYHGLGPHRPYWVEPERFEADILYLLRRGYHTVSLRQIEGYALHGDRLPEKPVLLTFDDGVESVYRYALPITERYKVPSVLFMIGSRIGRPGHLSAAQLREMQRSGLWSIEAHTYDMHRYVRGVRGYAAQMVNPRPLEAPADRAEAIRQDTASEAKAFCRAGIPQPTAFAFPFGKHDGPAIALLHAAYPVLFDSRPALARPREFLLPRLDATAAPLPKLLEAYGG